MDCPYWLPIWLNLNDFSQDYQGMQIFFACIPIGVVGFFSGWYQGKTAAAAIGLAARNPEGIGKAIVMVTMVETYAVFSLLASLLLFNGIII